MEEEVSVSALPWCWVIETLARSQQVNAALLNDLVSRAPSLLGDSGNVAKEVVALRCLEDLVGPPNRSIDDRILCHQSEIIGFDFAENCEDVLQRILRETSGGKQKDVLDELKWYIHSFIRHKKVSLPRCSLELLKNSIVQGTHPVAASLKEVSGLYDCRSMCPQLGNDESGHDTQATLVEENEGSPKHAMDYQLVVANIPHGNALTYERDTSRFHMSNHLQETDGISNDMDSHAPLRKKRKLDEQYEVHSQQWLSVPLGASRRSNNGQPSKAKETCDVKFYKKKFVGQSKIYVENHDLPHYSLDNDEHQVEENDLAVKKHAFLSSHGLLNARSFLKSETQTSLCVKCNKGLRLLTCSANTCSLAVHESCLGISPTFDRHGNFYCPFCAYSRAISKYTRAKREVALARKELSFFIGEETTYQPRQDSQRSLGKDVDETYEPKNGASAVTRVANPHVRVSTDKHQQLLAPSIYTAKSSFIASTHPHLSSEAKQGAEIIIHRARDAPGIQNQGQAHHGSNVGRLSHRNKRISSTSQECAEIEGKQENTGYQVTELHGDTFFKAISALDGLPEDEKCKASTSLPSPMPLSAIPPTSWRRKKVPWTSQEEELLKRGVQKFASGDVKAIPWRVILEFGISVFQRGRTPVDLKDKWRNILRRESPKPK